MWRCSSSATEGDRSTVRIFFPFGISKSTAHVRAQKGASTQDLAPWGKPSSEMHILSNANGWPVLVGISADNTHDSEGLKPMVEGHPTRPDPTSHPSACTRTGPTTSPDLRKRLRGKRIGVRIARTGIESSERQGPPTVGDRTHDVVALRLPQTQPPLRALSPRAPGLSRPRRRPLLLPATRPPHHVGHGPSRAVSRRRAGCCGRSPAYVSRPRPARRRAVLRGRGRAR